MIHNTPLPETRFRTCTHCPTLNKRIAYNPLYLYSHPPRAHIQQSAQSRHTQPNPPQPVCVDVRHHCRPCGPFLPIDWHNFGRSVSLKFRGRWGGRCGRGIECGRWEHFWRGKNKVHGVHGGAVELIKIQARDVVVRIGVLLISLWKHETSASLPPPPSPPPFSSWGTGSFHIPGTTRSDYIAYKCHYCTCKAR